MRPLRPVVFGAFTALFLLLAGCPGTRPGQPDPGADEFGLTVLSINLRDILNHPLNRTGVRWQERYSRVGQWLRNAPLKPDFIVLQEASGFWNCTFDSRRMPDYASIDFLLDEIRSATGETYRIAYLLTDKEGRSLGDAWIGDDLSGGCAVRSGKALLYRSSRLRNVLASTGNGLSFDTENRTTPHPINSLPCCFPASDRRNVCTVIDGPPQVTPRCATPSPSGVTWTMRHPGYTGGLVTSSAFSRFEFIGHPDAFVHLYNVHLVWNNNSPVQGVAAVNDLVTEMERRFSVQSPDRLYPPILIGDFNLDSAAILHNQPPAAPAPDNPRAPFFPRFDMAFWSPGLTGALIGRAADFPSKQRAYVKDAHALPSLGCEVDGGSPLTLWSDHCAVYLRIEPSP